MFWVDRTIAEIKESFAERLQRGEVLRLRDEKTISGRPHVGSLRSASLHAFLAEELAREGVQVEYLYEINDTDAFDKVPKYAPEEWAEHLGKPLHAVPSVSGKYANYAEEFGEEYIAALRSAGFPMEFYRNSARYAAGEYDQYITQALDKKDLIRQIYQEVSGSVKDENWYPVQVLCEQCGRVATTAVTGWDGTQVTYECSGAKYAAGCGHSGSVSPLGGRASLPWKVEWAAKWGVNTTDLEAAGKDHYAAGGSRLVSNRIAEEVFEIRHPFDVRHEFILVGGAKMSSSSGAGATAVEMSAMLPRHIFRYLLLHKDPMKTLDFSPEGDTLPLLFDSYDNAQKHYYMDESNEKRLKDTARAYELTYAGTALPEPMQLPKFSQLVFLCQMPHLDLPAQVEEIKGAPLTEAEKAELAVRVEYAQKWLDTYAPEQYRYKLGDYTAKYPLDATEKQAVQAVVDYLAANPEATGAAIHEKIHAIKEELGIEPRKLFQAFYRILLDRESGPQLGFMLASLPRAETVDILQKAVN